MTDTPPDSPPEGGEKKKRTVRRKRQVPTPDALAAARAKRLEEALLDNSGAIYDAIVVWDGEEDLRVPITTETPFDGKLLSAHYCENGWPSTSYDDDPVHDGQESIATGHLVFSKVDCQALVPAKPAKKTARKSAKKTSRKPAKKKAGAEDGPPAE